MLPIILQHVRELAEVHVSEAERDRYKIITPFPPSGPDFPDFAEEELGFSDQPADSAEASEDTLRAYRFFNTTDNLYYDYSYGIKSEDKRLSADICQKFFLEAQTDTSGIAFSASFAERRDAFLNRYKRQTAGTILGEHEFRYTSPSPVSWSEKLLNSSEIERLKKKAIAVYEDLQLDNVGFVKALIDEVRSSNYSKIAYEFGSFDVARDWMDPRLFESGEWAFSSGSRVLYGESDPFFVDNDVKLCYAQRFYVIRKYAATPGATPQSERPVVRDHRVGAVMDIRAHRRGAGRVRAGESRVDQDRRKVRNALIHEKVKRIDRALAPAAPPEPVPVPKPRAGFVWVPATATVGGHWERVRARSPPHPAAETPADKSSYKIAAVKCRVLPRTP